MFRKIVVGVLNIAAFALVTGCNSGNVQSEGGANLNTALETSPVITALASANISPSSGDDSCLKAVLEQTQSFNKLNTSITFNNTCRYDAFIGGYKVKLISEYTDDSKALLEPLLYTYTNVSGNSRNYILKFLQSGRYVCPNGNGSFETLEGTLGARKIKAGNSIVLKSVTTLASGKFYDLKLAKASFRVFSFSATVSNELGISLSDPESFNYARLDTNPNKGNDSLQNIPLNQYGLKTVLITNLRCNDLESAIPTLSLPRKVTIDRLRTTCKTDGTQRLLSEQSCRFVLRYDPQTNDAMQIYESLVNVDVYAKDVGNGFVSRSNIFSVPYSTRGKISGIQVVYNKIGILDNQQNGLKNISIGSFGLKTYTISNNSGQVLESLTFTYAPTALGLPLGLVYDFSRSTCKLDGTQLLSVGQSCNVAIKYIPKMQQVEESAIFQAVGYLANSNKSIAYASNKYLLAYSASLNNTPSIIPTTTSSINGFDIDANVSGLGFNNSIVNIPAGSFGLKAYLISNDTGQNMYNVNISNITALSALVTFKIDDTRSSCKFNTTTAFNKFTLKDGQSCLLVFKYAPTVLNKANINYDLMISGYDAAGGKIISEATSVQATSR